MNKILLLIFVTIIFFLVVVFFKYTPLFNFSIKRDPISFYRKNDTIVSYRYYKDINGNWILLDKNIVIPNNKTGIIYHGYLIDELLIDAE